MEFTHREADFFEAGKTAGARRMSEKKRRSRCTILGNPEASVFYTSAESAYSAGLEESDGRAKARAGDGMCAESHREGGEN
jgi:hypothetical protein